MVHIDPKKLSDEQLAALMLIEPDIAREELERRACYETMEEALSDLIQAVVDVRKVVDSIKQTAATRAVKETRILESAEKVCRSARLNFNIHYTDPVL